MKTFIFLAILIVAASTKKISFQNCASEKGLAEISFVDVTPCYEDPCVIKRGSNETVTIKFVPHEVVTRAKIEAYVSFWMGRFRLPLPNPNLCEGYGLVCPLKKGVPVELAFTEEVSENYPSGNYKLEADLKDQNGDKFICGIFHLTIA